MSTHDSRGLIGGSITEDGGDEVMAVNDGVVNIKIGKMETVIKSEVMWDKVNRVGLSFGPPNQVEQLKVVRPREWNLSKEPKSIISNVGPVGVAQSDFKVVDQSRLVVGSNLGKNLKKCVRKPKLQCMGSEQRVVESSFGKRCFESRVATMEMRPCERKAD